VSKNFAINFMFKNLDHIVAMRTFKYVKLVHLNINYLIIFYKIKKIKKSNIDIKSDHNRFSYHVMDIL